tara:strand:+ start:539 stop:742 length:204 start_codon:yes stop_codon:yes gene_type:complete
MNELSQKQKSQLKKYIRDKNVGPVGEANLYRDLIKTYKPLPLQDSDSEPELEFLITTVSSPKNFGSS